jgi:hypothetical protein
LRCRRVSSLRVAGNTPDERELPFEIHVVNLPAASSPREWRGAPWHLTDPGAVLGAPVDRCRYDVPGDRRCASAAGGLIRQVRLRCAEECFDCAASCTASCTACADVSLTENSQELIA